jgi:hypothetical protein
MARAIQTFFIYLLPRKKTLVALDRKLESLGWSSHHQALSTTRVTDYRGVNGRDRTNIRVGWDSHEGRLDTLWQAIVAPPGPCTVDRRGGVACGAGRRWLLTMTAPTATTLDEDQDNDEG